jgi:hypothetical protein
MSEQKVCAECGEVTGTINHIDLAWPNGRKVALDVHPQCEAACIERLERATPTIEKLEHALKPRERE